VGEGPIYKAVVKEFSCLEKGERSPHVVVYIVSSLPAWSEAEVMYKVGDLSTSSNIVEFSPDGSCRMRVSTDKEGCWHVWCAPSLTAAQKTMSSKPQVWQRWRSRSYLTVEETIGANIVFGPLVAILHMRLLELGGALIHGAGLASGGKGVLLSGWGGSGKTSLLGYIAAKHASTWEYLGDDLAVFDAHGNLGVVPLAMHLKNYNLTSSPELYAKVRTGQPLLQHWHWVYGNRFTKAKPMRRPMPNELFSLPDTNIPVRLAVHLDRYSGEEMAVRQISTQTFATQVTAGTLSEYSSILGCLLKAAALPCPAPAWLPTVLDLWARTETTVLKHLGEIPVWRILVPSHWNSQQVGSELTSHITELLNSAYPLPRAGI